MLLAYIASYDRSSHVHSIIWNMVMEGEHIVGAKSVPKAIFCAWFQIVGINYYPPHGFQ
jgi:hypothetical protein